MHGVHKDKGSLVVMWAMMSTVYPRWKIIGHGSAILKCEASLSVIYSGRHTMQADQRSQHSYVVLTASHEIKDEDACVGKGALIILHLRFTASIYDERYGYHTC